MTQLSSSGKTYVTGRGNIYLIDLHFNNIPLKRNEFMKVLSVGKEVSVDGIKGTIKGIEAFATGESYLHSKIGLLLKETND